jgi:hypothetical protein
MVLDFFVRFESMKTTLVKISEVKMNPNNPRIIKDEKFHNPAEYEQQCSVHPQEEIVALPRVRCSG